jgi:hypothetical protein
MNIAAIAACVAAGVSLVNVAVTARLARRGQREQWRRDEERPIVARMLKLSDDALAAWQVAATEKSRWIDALRSDDHDAQEERRASMKASWDAGSEKFDQLRLQQAELDLMAGERLRRTASDLVRKHEGLQHVIRPSGGADGPVALFIQYNNEIVSLRNDLIKSTRIDLGVDRSPGRRLLRGSR